MYNLTKSYSISVGWISTTFMLIFIQGMIILNLYLYFLVLDWPAQLSDVLPLHTASCYSSCLSHHWKICTRNLFYFPTYIKFNIMQNIVMAKHDQMNLHFFSLQIPAWTCTWILHPKILYQCIEWSVHENFILLVLIIMR